MNICNRRKKAPSNKKPRRRKPTDWVRVFDIVIRGGGVLISLLMALGLGGDQAQKQNREHIPPPGVYRV